MTERNRRIAAGIGTGFPIRSENRFDLLLSVLASGKVVSFSHLPDLLRLRLVRYGPARLPRALSADNIYPFPGNSKYPARGTLAGFALSDGKTVRTRGSPVCAM
jgi:hypothetical protein